MSRRVPAAVPLWIALSLLLAGGLAARAAEPKPEPKDAELSGAEFELQGEYVGEVTTPEGNSPVGVQIVARGGGRFASISYIGGLPGDGWDRTPRYSGEGELKNDAVEFKGGEYSSTVKDGVMTITLSGVKISELKKVDRESSSLGVAPPDGAVVLFDGSTVAGFDDGKLTEDGWLLPGCTSKEKFGSGKLHLEFREPFQPEARGTERGKGGVYLQGRYGVQILDSFGADESDTTCGAILGQKAPDQNMSYPPGSWQTLDIDFAAAEYDASGTKVKDPTVTVRQNGVSIARKATLPQTSPQATLSAVRSRVRSICQETARAACDSATSGSRKKPTKNRSRRNNRPALLLAQRYFLKVSPGSAGLLSANRKLSWLPAVRPTCPTRAFCSLAFKTR